MTQKKNAVCNAFLKLSLTPLQKSFATKIPSVQTMFRITYIPPASPTEAMNMEMSKAIVKIKSPWNVNNF